MTNFEKVKEFTKIMGQLAPDTLGFPNKDIMDLRIKLVEEEVKEFIFSVEDNDIINVAKELADILYVVYGCAVTLGIDLDKVFKAVHDSNMSKLDDDGKPIFREDGKILKGPNYKLPNIKDLLIK